MQFYHRQLMPEDLLLRVLLIHNRTKGMKHEMSQNIQSCALWFTQVEKWPEHTDLEFIVKLHKVFSDQKKL